MTLDDLSLSFCATVGVQSLVGCSINSKYSTSLEDVLQQRHLLLQGREEGLKMMNSWEEIRCFLEDDSYVNIRDFFAIMLFVEEYIKNLNWY